MYWWWWGWRLPRILAEPFDAITLDRMLPGLDGLALIKVLREAGCERPLGIVAEASYDDPYFAALSPDQKRDAAAFTHWPRTRPDFLSWSVADLPHAAPSLFRALGGKPVIAWTVRTPEQWARVRAYADQAVFEGDPG